MACLLDSSSLAAGRFSPPPLVLLPLLVFVVALVGLAKVVDDDVGGRGRDRDAAIPSRATRTLFLSSTSVIPAFILSSSLMSSASYADASSGVDLRDANWGAYDPRPIDDRSAAHDVLAVDGLGS